MELPSCCQNNKVFQMFHVFSERKFASVRLDFVSGSLLIVTFGSVTKYLTQNESQLISDYLLDGYVPFLIL